MRSATSWVLRIGHKEDVLGRGERKRSIATSWVLRIKHKEDVLGRGERKRSMCYQLGPADRTQGRCFRER